MKARKTLSMIALGLALSLGGCGPKGYTFHKGVVSYEDGWRPVIYNGMSIDSSSNLRVINIVDNSSSVDKHVKLGDTLHFGEENYVVVKLNPDMMKISYIGNRY